MAPPRLPTTHTVVPTTDPSEQTRLEKIRRREQEQLTSVQGSPAQRLNAASILQTLRAAPPHHAGPATAADLPK